VAAQGCVQTEIYALLIMPNGENLLTEFEVFTANMSKLLGFQPIPLSAGARAPNRPTTPKSADVVDSLAERRLSRAMSPGCFGPLPEQVAARVSGITRMPPRLNPIPPHRD
jgi:hypothetical protein